MPRFESDVDHRTYYQGPSPHVADPAHLHESSAAFCHRMRAMQERLAASLAPPPPIVDADPGDEAEWWQQRTHERDLCHDRPRFDRWVVLL